MILGKQTEPVGKLRSDNSTNGWSAYGGQTFAAYYPEQDPSGSSSGSGVASLWPAVAALGSEVRASKIETAPVIYIDSQQTSGSILSPSNVNNLVGIKPTVGLTSRTLVIPISQRQDTVGPMARTVKDAAYVLQAIAGKDPLDNYTLAEPFDTPPDYVAACNFSSLKGPESAYPVM